MKSILTSRRMMSSCPNELELATEPHLDVVAALFHLPWRVDEAHIIQPGRAITVAAAHPCKTHRR